MDSSLKIEVLKRLYFNGELSCAELSSMLDKSLPMIAKAIAEIAIAPTRNILFMFDVLKMIQYVLKKFMHKNRSFHKLYDYSIVWKFFFLLIL